MPVCCISLANVGRYIAKS